MGTTIRAVYENGVLRPLEPLALQEHQTVRLQLMPEVPAAETASLIQALVAAGLVTPPQGETKPDPLSDTERQQLAIRLGQAATRPLSEMIIEERGE